MLLAPAQARRIPGRLWIAAGALAALALANLVVAGQPWGVVYGLGLWAAKGAEALGADLSASAFWSAPVNQARLDASILTDVTSLTNIGIILGAFLVAAWRNGLSSPIPKLPALAWASAIVAGLLLGYSSRLAFGCNVGAFFSGISTGSLHGWAWFTAAFVGSYYGIRLRPDPEAGGPAMSAGRGTIAAVVVAALALGVGLDIAASEPLNPYRSPPLVALGSGQATSGAHCTAVPGG